MCYTGAIMKIAMMVRGFLQTPVPGDIAYSPATVAQAMAEGLSDAGHKITFFGPEGTDIKVAAIETLSIRPIAKTQSELDDFVGGSDLFRNYSAGLYDSRMAKTMLERAAKGEFDCVVFHHFESALPIASLFPDVPVIYILHDYIDDRRREMIEMHTSPNQHFISISDSQRRDAPDLNYSATVYNGIDTDLFTTDGEAEDYLMISGRITSIKGVKEAVQIALQTDRRLLISGSLSRADSAYFDEHVKPFLNNKVLFLGMLEREQLIKYYQKAAALLFPIQWQEPFGLAMTEAGACGTPVIAFNRGSVPEVIVDKHTGFIVNNSAEMIMAIDKLPSIKRKNCRAHVVKNFSHDIMIEKYSATIEEIVKQCNGTKKQSAQSSRKAIHQKVKKISNKLLGS